MLMIDILYIPMEINQELKQINTFILSTNNMAKCKFQQVYDG